MSKVRTGQAQPDTAGPLPSGEPAFLAVGKLLHPHGIRGEILMEVYTDFPERLEPGMTLYLHPDMTTVHLTGRRSHKNGLIMSFEGYSSPEAIGQFRNHLLFVKTDERPPLAEGEYYHHQLLNLRVISDTGVSLGVVTEILETGASDVLVVRPEFGPEVLIPIVDTFVKEINLPDGAITVHLIPGLLSEER